MARNPANQLSLHVGSGAVLLPLRASISRNRASVSLPATELIASSYKSLERSSGCLGLPGNDFPKSLEANRQHLQYVAVVRTGSSRTSPETMGIRISESIFRQMVERPDWTDCRGLLCLLRLPDASPWKNSFHRAPFAAVISVLQSESKAPCGSDRQNADQPSSQIEVGTLGEFPGDPKPIIFRGLDDWYRITFNTAEARAICSKEIPIFHLTVEVVAPHL